MYRPNTHRRQDSLTTTVWRAIAGQQLAWARRLLHAFECTGKQNQCAQVHLGLPPLQCSRGAPLGEAICCSAVSLNIGDRAMHARQFELDRCVGQRLASSSGGCACPGRDPCSPVRRAQHFVQAFKTMRFTLIFAACCVPGSRRLLPVGARWRRGMRLMICCSVCIV